MGVMMLRVKAWEGKGSRAPRRRLGRIKGEVEGRKLRGECERCDGGKNKEES